MSGRQRALASRVMSTHHGRWHRPLLSFFTRPVEKSASCQQAAKKIAPALAGATSQNFSCYLRAFRMASLAPPTAF
jgi:hypothetical protein